MVGSAGSERRKCSMARSNAVQLPQLLTAEEVAEMLQVAPRTVNDWAAAGEIPSVRLGLSKQSPRRYEAHAILAWLRSRAEGATS